MKVSVITPCYNAARYIGRTVASVQAQTLSDWEMIIIDDGSTDNSAGLVASLAEQDPRIRLVRKENGGSASARNIGLHYAHGEYIQFLDADDTLAPDKFARQTALMDAHSLDVSHTDYRMVSPTGEVEPRLLGRKENLLHLLVGWGIFGTIALHCYLYRRTFILAHDIRFAKVKEREDWDWHLKLFSCHPKAKYLQGYCGAYYFRSAGSKTGNGSMATMRAGNCRFLCYRIMHSPWWQSLLLLMRLSLELWTAVLQMLRYRLWDMPHTLHNIFSAAHMGRLCLLIAILLLPLSLPIYIASFIYGHYKEHLFQKYGNKSGITPRH